MTDISSYDRWHLNGFNLCEVIVIHDGPDSLGRTYVDGRHQHSIATYATVGKAQAACDRHNRVEPTRPAPATASNPGLNHD